MINMQENNTISQIPPPVHQSKTNTENNIDGVTERKNDTNNAALRTLSKERESSSSTSLIDRVSVESNHFAKQVKWNFSDHAGTWIFVAQVIVIVACVAFLASPPGWFFLGAGVGAVAGVLVVKLCTIAAWAALALAYELLKTYSVNYLSNTEHKYIKKYDFYSHASGIYSQGLASNTPDDLSCLHRVVAFIVHPFLEVSYPLRTLPLSMSALWRRMNKHPQLNNVQEQAMRERMRLVTMGSWMNPYKAKKTIFPIGEILNPSYLKSDSLLTNSSTNPSTKAVKNNNSNSINSNHSADSSSLIPNNNNNNNNSINIDDSAMLSDRDSERSSKSFDDDFI